jgi:hypothetical protein
VHGPAGAGKSAIALTVAEKCVERRQLAASFFFSRSAPPRDTARLFFTTLAWQLASSTPSRRHAICQAVADDMDILDQQHSIQIERLIVKPFLSPVDSEKIQNPFLVIVDGLDECKLQNDQTQLLDHIYDLVKTPCIPLRFLIVSRPEPHIHRFFATRQNQTVSTEISIEGDRQAPEDIRQFLRSRFDEMTESGRHTHSLEYETRPWPSNRIISDLRDRSEGYFIYASTGLNYIDDENFSCVRRLEEVLDASRASSSTSIFGELDKLYTQILSACPNTHPLVRVLGGLLTKPIPERSIEVECLELIYNLRHGEIMQMLRNLHSVLKTTTEHDGLCSYTTVRSHHASFLDFLFDKNRAVVYHIDHDEVSRAVYEGAVSFISNYRSRTSSIEYESFLSNTLIYSSLLP